MTENATQRSSNDSYRPEGLFEIKYPMRTGSLVLVVVGVGALIPGAPGLLITLPALVVAVVLLCNQPNRGEQVAQQLRQEFGETAVVEARAFRLCWKNRWGGGNCEFSSLETSGKAVQRLLEANEAEGYVECYEIILLPEVGKVPIRWSRWSAQEQQWEIEWCADQFDIGVCAKKEALRRQAEFRRMVIHMHH